MPFIGNQPALSYTSFAKQDFTTSATTSYTLDNPVANENEIALFINFVRQEPTTAYTASGTNLNLTSATSASDDMYCVFLGKAVQTVNPPNSSVGSSQVSADLITGQTALGATPADTDELLISDAGTLKRVDFSYLKVANTPAFHAYKSSSDNSVTDNTYVKVTLESELLDSDNAWDVSTSKFTPQVAGKYLIMGAVYVYAGSTGTLRNSYTLIYKNGSEVGYARNNFQANDISASHVTFQAVVDMNGSTDYVELYGAIDVTSGTPYFGQGSKSTYMLGYRIIGA